MGETSILERLATLRQLSSLPSTPLMPHCLSTQSFFDISHRKDRCSSVRRKRLRESPHIVLERALVPQELHVRTVDAHLPSLALGDILVAIERCEAPLLGDDDLLAAGKLVLAAAESLDGGRAV